MARWATGLLTCRFSKEKGSAIVSIWNSSRMGERFTRTLGWTLLINGPELIVHQEGRKYKASLTDEEAVSTAPGFFWTSVDFKTQEGKVISLDGIPNEHAVAMTAAIKTAYSQFTAGEKKRSKLEEFDRLLAPLVSWRQIVVQDFETHKSNHRWIAEETLQGWDTVRPAVVGKDAERFSALLKDAVVAEHFKGKDQGTKYAVDLWKADLRPTVIKRNEEHFQAELIACKDFFNKVEKSPLTVEQAKSVVCFDNRVLTIASAGSGKTSTMVAKAAYALLRKLVSADKILLLAFNKDAAEELQQRVHDRLTPLGFRADAVVARTFHAFGLDVIGKATGRKPSLAAWLDNGKDIEHLAELIDGLKDKDALFRTKWDLFRIVLSRDLPQFGKEEEDTEDRDRNTKKYGFRTLRNEVVKSHGERMIADWLFYNGVDYRYEQPYEHDTATESHRQYNPDFYYADVDLYHEHFAFDQNGAPPPQFKGYMDGVKWKRGLHKQHKTALIETTSAQLRTGKAFAILEAELTKRGIVLDPNPERPVEGRKPINNEDLVKVFRTFLTHAKSNRLTDADLRQRLHNQTVGNFVYRHELFLDIFVEVRKAWEKSLADGRCIDFEDMLNLASDHMDAGRWQSPYELVMIDEFQDASWARARITRALVRKPGRFLFAVGDDWQSINRFAGSDISVMTKFEEWFGRAIIVRLERTFRCPQSLCDVSSKFVLKNPSQISKKVRSLEAEHPPAVELFQVDDDEKLQDSVDKFLAGLHRKILNGEVASPKKGKKISVFVLGRYKVDKKYIPDDWEKKYSTHLELKFSSVHGSKGLEADYVILPRVVSGYYSFPSTIEDDPVLQLAMPSEDTYAFSEERRLFYVALTRARRSVTIFTVDGRMSPFVVELINDIKLEVQGIDGKKSKTAPCPKCGQGTLTKRTGPYSDFFGCTRFPRCDYKQKIQVKNKSLERT
ncbi:UvrD-helicase domain-containing protein [Janthinobacterium sp. SUN033]|uniref:UvrD-helicase domain-containing protein n=1 Tax=Janthinobacterium sp. SUN033 TaxID=3002439 RepID=UPI0025B21AD3|nr:UvrD-helicase domain-containing protein [Janthinobacterium sp. SUN033]MDN2677674.1 UvrD-helicase domain-containing protein [Janthinobacterium sp. SUN033]